MSKYLSELPPILIKKVNKKIKETIYYIKYVLMIALGIFILASLVSEDN